VSTATTSIKGSNNREHIGSLQGYMKGRNTKGGIIGRRALSQSSLSKGPKAAELRGGDKGES